MKKPDARVGFFQGLVSFGTTEERLAFPLTGTVNLTDAFRRSKMQERSLTGSVHLVATFLRELEKVARKVGSAAFRRSKII